jgi:hypothetical protein
VLSTGCDLFALPWLHTIMRVPPEWQCQCQEYQRAHLCTAPASTVSSSIHPCTHPHVMAQASDLLGAALLPAWSQGVFLIAGVVTPREHSSVTDFLGTPEMCERLAQHTITSSTYLPPASSIIDRISSLLRPQGYGIRPKSKKVRVQGATNRGNIHSDRAPYAMRATVHFPADGKSISYVDFHEPGTRRLVASLAVEPGQVRVLGLCHKRLHLYC